MQLLAISLGRKKLPHRSHFHKFRCFFFDFFHGREEFQRFRLARGKLLRKSSMIAKMPPKQHERIDVAPHFAQVRHQAHRRFTRLTNAFSEKIDNLGHAVALHFMHYDFCRDHQTLRVTPAMEAGVAQHVASTSGLLQNW